MVDTVLFPIFARLNFQTRQPQIALPREPGIRQARAILGGFRVSDADVKSYALGKNRGLDDIFLFLYPARS